MFQNALVLRYHQDDICEGCQARICVDGRRHHMLGHLIVSRSPLFSVVVEFGCVVAGLVAAVRGRARDEGP